MSENKNSNKEKKPNLYKIYLIMENEENDPSWSVPELIGVETDYDDALEAVYREACDLFVDCSREEDEIFGKHHPLINKESDNGYVVIDEKCDMRRSYYIVEKEVEV